MKLFLKVITGLWNGLTCFLGFHDYRFVDADGNYHERQCQKCNKIQVKPHHHDREWHDVIRTPKEKGD